MRHLLITTALLVLAVEASAKCRPAKGAYPEVEALGICTVFTMVEDQSESKAPMVTEVALADTAVGLRLSDDLAAKLAHPRLPRDLKIKMLHDLAEGPAVVMDEWFGKPTITVTILDSANRIVAVAKCRNRNVSVALNE